MLLTATFFALSMSDPRLALGWFALVAVIGAFASATQDVVIDAWRIDVADEKAPVEILSSIYQFGYRIAALIGGALALVLSERMSLADGLCDHGRVHGADHHRHACSRPTRRATRAEREQTALRKARARSSPSMRAIGLAIVGARLGVGDLDGRAASWSRMLGGAVDPATGKPPVGRAISPSSTARWIVAATVILPAIVAAVLQLAAGAQGRACADRRRARGHAPASAPPTMPIRR